MVPAAEGAGTMALESSVAGGRLEVVDGHGRAPHEVEVSESILLKAEGLRPDAHHAVRVLDDGGDEVLTAQLLADRYGRIEPTVVWPDVGIGDPDGGGRFAFADIDEAAAALRGLSFTLELRADGDEPLATSFTMAGDLTRPRLLPSDAEGRLQRGVLAGRDPLHVSGLNLPAGALVDLYLVHRQFDWRPGDQFTPVVGPDGTEAALRVQLRRDESRFHTEVWDGSQAVPGSYDLIARVVVPHEFRASDRVLRQTDLVSERLLTTLVVRRDIYAYKPVFLGCVMAQQIAGRNLAGAPYFRYTENFPRGTDVLAALDPAGLMPAAIGRKVRISVAHHKDPAAWDADSSFTPLPGTGAEIVTTPGCINGNRALVWSNPQQAGRYDLVVDFGNNDPNPANFVADDSFDPPDDMIDGYFTVGFHVTDDPSVAGPHAVGSTSYDEPAATIPAAGTWLGWDPFVVGSTPSGTLDLPLRAIVRYPAVAAGVDTAVSAAETTYPVVLVSPGMGLLNTGYGYLLDHLASHGFVAVALDATALNGSIVGGGSFDSRAHAALAHLALLRAKHQNPGLFQGRLDLSRIVVVGHSRGGDGALATAVFNQALGLGWGIRGVVALAPTDWSGTGPAPLSLSAGAYLCLHGSNDNDVGRMAGVPFATGFNGLGFRAYDRATTEKAMILIRDATHNLFNADATSEHSNYPAAVHLSRTDHETLLRGYVNAFAQWHLQGRTEQRAYFTGELRIPAADGIEVHAQYRPRAAQVRTLDSFQSAPAIATNTLGGAVSTTALAGPATEDALSAVDRNSPHQTRGLRLRWSTTAATYASGIPLGANRDISSFTTLSFRVSQTFGYLDTVSDGLGYWPHPPPLISAGLDMGTISAEFRSRLTSQDAVAFGSSPVVSTLAPGLRWRIVDGGAAYRADKVRFGPFPRNPPATPYYWEGIVLRLEGPQSNQSGQAQDLYVRLATAGGGPARSVRAGYFGPIPFPMRPVVDPLTPYLDDARTLVAMKTIRIPLSSWTVKCLNAPIVDLTNVESVTFELSATGSGELLIDDIEFAS